MKKLGTQIRKRIWPTLSFIFFILIGLFFLHPTAQAAGTPSVSHSQQTPFSTLTYHYSKAPTNPTKPTAPATPSALLPCDVAPWQISCIEASVAQWVAQGVVNALSPLTTWIAHDPENVVFYTDPGLTYQNPDIVNAFHWILAVTNGLLIIFLIIAGYQIMTRAGGYHENLQALPAVALAAIAANFALTFIGPIIDINNAICDFLRTNISISLLTNFLEALFSGNIASINPILLILYFVYASMALYLGGQMIMRIVVLNLLIIFSSVWTFAFGLRQTAFLARSMSRAFFLTVFLQVIQMMAIGLGEILTTAMLRSSNSLFNLDQTFVQTIVGIAVLSVIVKIPRWLGAVALNDTYESMRSSINQVQQSAYQALRLAAAFA